MKIDKISIDDITLKINSDVDILDLLPIAQKIIDVDFYGAMDAGATTDSIMSDIIMHPITVIKYLLSVIEEYQDNV